MSDPRVTVVLLTHQRPVELDATLAALRALPERPPVIVVDNASRPGTVAQVVAGLEGVSLVRSERNLGAAGRNLGVAQVATPYVAFCDDDTAWAPGSLARAADVLDAHPDVHVISARVRVGAEAREDPTCRRMRDSPLDRGRPPGPGLVSFMAGACVMRTDAFRAVGGYEPRLFLGAEEWLMALDVAARGGRLVHVTEVVTHHHPSRTARDPAGRHAAVARNRLWIAWMRLPARLAWRESREAWREAVANGVAARVLREALAGAAWALARRRVVPREVVARIEAVRRHERELDRRAATTTTTRTAPSARPRP